MGGLFRQIVTPFYFPWQVAKNSFCFLNDRPVAPVGLALFLCSTRIVRVDALQVRPERFLPVLTWTASSFGRSRPAADAAREVVERRLLVRSLQKIGTMSAKGGAPFEANPQIKLKSNWKKENLRVVVFVQVRKSWRILGAASAKVG